MTYQLAARRLLLVTAILVAIALTLFLTAPFGKSVALAQANDQGGNSPATGLPTIGGTVQVGETLTADTSDIADEDGLDNATFSYQWLSSRDTEIDGATTSTYTLVETDEGQTVKVRVSFTDDADNQEMLTSAPTAAVAAPAQADSEDEPSELSYLTVVVTEDDSDPDNVVTTFTITWNDAEDCSASYNAYLDGVVGDPIHLGSAASEGEQIAASLTNVSAESIGFDAKLYCGTIGSGRLVDSLMIPEYSRSFDTVPISRAYLPKPGTYSTEPGLTVLTVSSGTLTPAFHSQTLNYTVPDVANADGRITLTTTTKADYYTVAFIPGSLYFYSFVCSHGGQQTSVSYQDDTGNPLYPLTDADANTPGFQMELDEGENVFKIRVWPNCESGHGYKLTVTRAANAPANTPATGAPTIGGAAQVGETLTVDTSGIADADGLSGATFSYQWLSSRDTEIQGATDAAYILVPGDASKTIKVRVSFTDDEGNAETLTSAATGAVAPRPNSPATGAPTIGGTAQVGETLTVETSGIADADGLTEATFSYQWLSSRDTEITGATDSTYTLAAADEGKTVKVKVSFTDDADNEETLTSVATTAVAGAVDSGAPSYITVEVTEDYSDPINIVTNFAITWNDAAVCSVDYNAYLNIKPSTLTGDETEGSQLHLGSAASDGAQITAGLTGVQGGFRGFDVELYCGTDGSGRLVSRVVIPGEYTRPKPGTYSSEPPLSALGVSHGTMTPTFQGGTSSYTVPDVANAETRTTITATPTEGNFVKFSEGSDSPIIGLIVDAWGLGPRPSGLSEDCSRGFGDYYGPLIEMTDADPDTPGFQMDLYDGTSSVWVHVYPTAICSLGKSYALTITRAEGEISLPRPNRPAIGLPFIAPPGRDPGSQGTYLYFASPCVGCTMNAYVSSIKDRDGWDESTFSYQWLADDAEITGATDFSYTVADTDLGKTLKVRVSFTDGRGNEETLTSHATEVVRLRNFGPTGKPVILGTAEVGQTLRVDVSGISDPNGMTNAAFTYQWVNTPWTDSNEYTLADRDEGRRIWLRAAYTDDAGHRHVLESESTDAVAARPSSPATGAPTIRGTIQVGETLTVDTSGIADENGLENVAYTYQWLSSRDNEIGGATSSTYTLQPSDEGKTVKVQVSFTDDAGNNETLTSAATDPVVSAALPPPPDNLRAVTQKSGAVELTWEAPGNATVTGYRIDRRHTSGDHSDQERSAGSHRDNHTLVEDTGSTNTGYTDTGAEKGVEYEYRVSARNEAGAGAGSDWVRAGPEPVSNNPATGLPSIGGTAQVGGTLTVETSGIADADGLTGATFSYQWLSSRDTEITGATDSTYTLVAADEGKAIKVRISFTDDADNQEMLTSVATTAVAGAVDSGAPSYITVEVTEDYSDPINIVTNFAITWSDTAVCSVDYNAYLNIKPSTLTGDETEGSQLHLGSAASDGAQITAGLTGVQGGFRGFDVELYCGTDGSGRLVSRVVIPGEYTRPKPGTYSSEPPLSALGVSHGTMTPTFQGGTSSYTVPDVANAETRTTITATPTEGNFVKFSEGSDSPIIGLIVDAWGLGPRPSGLSEDCSRGFGDYYGPLIEMTDADPDTPGFQMDLYDGTSSVWVHVYPTAICSLGKSYALTITRAEGEISLPRPNRPAIGLPFIAPPGRDPGSQGTYLYFASPCVGCTMNAYVSSIKDRDGWDESTFSYQWLADDAEITGATDFSYTVADTDLGKTLKVRVSFTDGRGNEETLTSHATEVVRLRNFGPTGKPVILGTAEVGQTLRVDVSGISDPNGMTNAAFTYQWVNTPWTDSNEYTLADRDEGRRIWLRAAYTDDAGHRHVLESESTDAVAARPSSPATGAPTIRGTIQVGETLTVDTSGIADADGLTGATFSYQWLGSRDAEIQGATNATYTLVTADEGKAIKVRVSFTDDAGNEESLTSASTAAVSAKLPPPDNVRAVTQKSGAVQLTWEAPDGANVTGYRIERSRADENRGGQQRSVGSPKADHTLVEDTGSADTGYTDESAERGVEYEYRVSARNEAGTGEASEWVRAGPESASNAPATGAPTISGTAQVGETLTAGITGIADADGLGGETFTYQWVSNDGTTDTDMENATGSTYKLVAADQGKAIKVGVTFTDGGGNEETLTSAPTGPVFGDGLPGAPRNLAATAGNKEVTLSWDPPEDNGNAPAARYRIEWRVDGKDYGTSQWGTSRETTYTTNDQANLANGVKYFFRVKAENDDGNSYGPYGPASEEVSATPTSGSAVDLGTPVLSDTETLHHGMVRLDWQDVEDAGWYVVQHYHLEGGEWLDLPAEGVDIAFHGSSAVVSNLHGLSWLRVGAASCDGASEWSQIEELYGTKESDWEGVPVPEVEAGDEIEPCPVVLGTPVLSEPENLHHGMVKLDWQDIEDAGWYVVQYYHLEGGEWLDLPAEGVDIAFHGSSAVVSNLHGLSWLRVGAASCDGASEWSQIEELYGTNASDWEGVPVPEVAEGDEIEPCDEDPDTPENSPATGAPTISGTVQVAETLEADTSGVADADGLSNVQYEYQWLADDADISGATNATYTLADADEGKAIKVQVSFTDDADNEESLTSAATDAVAAAPTPNSPATGAPTISGTVQVAETLEANTSGIADADGLGNVQYEYQWLADDAEIAGATSLTYALSAADEGKAIKVEVSFTDDAGNEETLTSVATDAVAAAPTPNSPATGAPTITGTAQVGETLTANTSGIADADGLGSVRYEYQWLADDSEIGGASSLTYTLADTEEGKAIKVQVSFTDDAGNEETLTSEATDAVAGAQPTEPPDKPKGLEATASHGQVVLTWNDPQDESITGYVILRRVRVNDQGGDFSVLVADTGSAATIYTDNEVAASTTYTYRIKAINEHGVSERSRWVHIDTPAPPVPDKPTGLEATASNGQVVLTWDDPDDDSITGYVILRRLPGVDAEGHFDELVANTGTASTTYTDTSVSAETRYTYRIKAINEHGTSERSRWVHIDTPAAP